jgi:hypothetical protein
VIGDETLDSIEHLANIGFSEGGPFAVCRPVAQICPGSNCVFQPIVDGISG